METERRRKPRQLLEGDHKVELCWTSDGEAERVLEVRAVDVSEQGIGIECAEALDEGGAIRLRGAVPGFDLGGAWRTCFVVWCRPGEHGGHRAGIFVRPVAETTAAGEGFGDADYYELLQLHPTADAETLSRVYRHLSQRFHPENPETGNEEAFKEIVRAFSVLSDPRAREAYDERLQAHRERSAKIFAKEKSADGVTEVRHVRRGILDALYKQRLNEPTRPYLTIRAMQKMLGCDGEALEFPLWYLRESGMVSFGDNGRYLITARGVDAAERGSSRQSAAQQKRMMPKMLTAPVQAPPSGRAPIAL